MTIKVLNEFLPNAEIQRVGAVKVGDTLEITQDEGVLNVDPASVVSAYYSNIITEIAQDVKLELNDGTLTLKSGSVVTKPDGTQYQTTSDTSTTISSNGTYFIFPRTPNVTISTYVSPNRVGSGSTLPEDSSTYAVFFNTTENIIYNWNWSLNRWVSIGLNFPIAIVTVSSGQVTSIDQVFNGAGYIGHHAFILPGLKGVAPDGLGDKGYVKSANIEVDNVLVYDLTSGSVTNFDSSFLFLNPLLEVACQQYITLDRAKELVRTTGLIQYAYQENKDYAWNGTAYVNPINLPVVECSLKNSAVTYFRILQPLRMATVSDIKESTDSFLFDYKWADHNPNKLSWLRADTFNWQDGATYKSAYKHLIDDFNGTTSATETISSNTITYYLAADKHKIVLPDQESAVQAIYNETGIAWYYILDTANTRFKLPRTKFGFVGIRDGVGNYVPESVPNITGHSCLKQNDNDGNPAGAFYRANSNAYTGFNSGAGHFIDFDASRSSSAYQDNAPVQQRATQMYLYCYVGRANQDALEKSEIDITAFTNNSINQLTSAKNASLSAINTATEEGINRLNTDSNALNRTQITNCITEIPQGIKLSLNNGTLTLQSGSKVYIPNGAGVFNVVNISSDYVLTQEYATQVNVVLFVKSGGGIELRSLQTICSGPNDTITGVYHFWYDTTNNIIRVVESNGSYRNYTLSFPFAIVKMSGTGASVASIEQVFNGFGYIGSTAFVLPGVKGLIPNGRNVDGTLKNIAFEITTVKTNTRTNDTANTLVLSGNDVSQQRFPASWNYDAEKNIVYNVAANSQRSYCVVGQVLSESTKITLFQPKTTFRAVDYNDIKQLSDEAVKVTGDQDVDGIKRFLKPIYSKLPYLDTSTAATSNVRQNWICAYDKNDTEVGNVRSEYLTDNSLNNSLTTIRQVNNSTIYSSIYTGITADGKKYQGIDFPGDTDAMRNQIDTVSARNTALNKKQDITTAVNYDNITNCITEIPQDIKLELNNGTLTLKTGSKIYAPNGTGVFDVLNITTDKTVETYTTTGSVFVFARTDGSNVYGNQLVSSFSSGTSPSTGMYYKTDTNEINLYNSGTFVDGRFSFPVAIVSVSNGTVQSIDQVFNGFGYIGSTEFVLPGVKGLIPNGRNADGSLKNIEVVSEKVITYTRTINGGQFILGFDNKTTNNGYQGYVSSEVQPTSGYYLWYKPSDNFIYKVEQGVFTGIYDKCIYGTEIRNESSPYNITSFQPKTTFHAVDYNDAVKHSDIQVVSALPAAPVEGVFYFVKE